MKRHAILLAIVAAFALVLPANGQVPSDTTIAAVEIQGLERVSESLVRSQLEVQPGQTFNHLAIARDIRRLFEINRFDQIRAERRIENGQLIVTYIVQELRYIDEVLIIGNRKVRDRQIRAEISWLEGDSFYADGYEAERDAVLNLYRSKGYLNTTVDIVVEEISTSRVRVNFQIDEGRKARITDITIAGNDVLSDRRIRKLMKTKQRRFWIFGGRYDENVFEEDLTQVVREYRNHGRMEADILDTTFIQSADGKKLEIEIDVSEGPEYTVENLEIANNVAYDEDELRNTIEVSEGEVHDQGQVEDDAEAIAVGYRDSGYVDARVTPQITLNRDRKTTNVSHIIDEALLKYIREIKITGNSVTKDEVIRRRVLLAPGDRFDGAALRSTQNQLEALQYFETPPRITREPIPGEDRFENLVIDVEEGRTGNFNFGAGYSTAESLGGFVEFRLRNFDISNWPTFSGGGQQLLASLNIGDVRSEYSLSFTEPEFMGYPLSFGIDLFNQSYRTRGGSTYTQDTQGGQIRFAKGLSPYTTLSTSFRVADVEIDNFTADLLRPLTNRDVRELNDPGTTVANRWGIVRNTLNHFRDPTGGAVHSFETEVAGFGGDNDFLKFEHDSAWYKALDEEEKWVLSFRTREGVSFPYGDKDLVSLNDRFFAGGASTVRGYDSRDIGPKTRTFLFFGSEQAIGGEMRLINNLELRYKLTNIVNLYGFVDAGGVWKTVSDFDIGDMKYSFGIGLGAQIPQFGPIRIDYGFPINPDGDQGSGQLHLTTGIRF